MSGSSDTVTWSELWEQTAAAIGDRQHARWLCEVASAATSGDEFLDRLREPATVRMVAHLHAMVVRVRAGEPLQYVLGEWSFRLIELAIDRRALIPRPETELVVDAALDKLAGVGPTRTVADLGTGSGAIGLSLAAESPLAGTTVWITDADPDALDLARANTAGIGRKAANVRAELGSWFEALPDGVAFDAIVSNPPYVAEGSHDLDPSVLEWEPASALFAGPDGLDDIRRLVSAAPAHLAPGGWLVLEIGAGQGPAVRELFESAGYREVEIRPDLAGHDRIALGRRR